MRSPLSNRGYSQQPRVAVNAEGRFLAHWDEFVEHRKEVQAKLEEAFEMASERRDAGLRLARLCQQMETKVDRLARQGKEQLTKSESLEDRVGSFAKSLDASKEAIEVLRDKTQRQVQDLSTALSSSKSELLDELEKHHQSFQEAMRRGDRCLAEEFFRKLQENGEKLSGNLQVLEDALATFVRQTRVQLAELSEQFQANKDLVNKLSESSQVQMKCLQEDLGGLAQRAQACESADLEQVRLVQLLESKIAKLQESVTRFDSRVAGNEETEKQRNAQLLEQVREAKEQNASALLRARGEWMDALAEATSASREESKEALCSAQRSLASDLQALKEELRKSLQSNVERQQLLVDELRVEMNESGEFARSNGRELLALIEELQGQVVELRSESRRNLEDVTARVRAENQANVEDLKAQLRTLRLELGEARQESKISNEEVKGTLEESGAHWRRSMGEVVALTAKSQTTADEAVAELARLQVSVEAVAELQRASRGTCQQVAALERLAGEMKEELSRQGDARSEVLKSNAAFQRETSELGRRLEGVEHSVEEAASKARDQGRELSRSLSDRISEVEERLLRTAEQHDLSLLSVRNELARVAGAAQDMAPEVEQACRRLIGEEAQLQAEKWQQSFQHHKEVSGDVLQSALAEPRAEVKALRLTLSEQEAALSARLERLNGEMRQDRATSSRLKHDMEELTVSCEERVAVTAAALRQAMQEQRSEVFKQLDPIMERLSEVSATMQASRRTEAELGSHFERLLVTTEELCAGQEALSAQGADTAQSLNDLRSEIRNVGSSQELSVKQLASPRIWRSPLRKSDGEVVAEPLLRSPEDNKERVVQRSLQSSPEKPLPDASAFSRLGELRRRLAPVHQDLAEPTTIGSARGSVTQGRPGLSSSGFA